MNSDLEKQTKGENKMFCINCGTKLPDGSKFCSECGTNQELISEGFVKY